MKKDKRSRQKIILDRCGTGSQSVFLSHSLISLRRCCQRPKIQSVRVSLSQCLSLARSLSLSLATLSISLFSPSRSTSLVSLLSLFLFSETLSLSVLTDNFACGFFDEVCGSSYLRFFFENLHYTTNSIENIEYLRISNTLSFIRLI